MLEPHVSFESLISEFLSQTTSSRAEQSNITSCHASPVAERKSTKTACGNVWKLLLRNIDVSASKAILPNTCGI